MSKAYLFHKNFTFKEMVNLVCYSSKYPETLSHVQKVTRLYRSVLRRHVALFSEGYKSDHGEFNYLMSKVSKDFHKMIDLPSESPDLKILLQKWEKWQEDYYDPNAVMEESRPYSSTSSRYPIWSDEALRNDPFGYYSKERLTSEKQPEDNFPYYETYPMVDTHWDLPEVFGPGYTDVNSEAVDAEERNAKINTTKKN